MYCVWLAQGWHPADLGVPGGWQTQRPSHARPVGASTGFTSSRYCAVWWTVTTPLLPGPTRKGSQNSCRPTSMLIGAVGGVVMYGGALYSFEIGPRGGQDLGRQRPLYRVSPAQVGPCGSAARAADHRARGTIVAVGRSSLPPPPLSRTFNNKATVLVKEKRRWAAYDT